MVASTIQGVGQAMVRMSIAIVSGIKNRYVLEAVNSALEQSNFLDYEIFTVMGYQDKNIETIIKGKNVGLIYSQGIVGKQLAEIVEKCQGEYISFLDDDDLFHENKLNTVLSIINSNPDIGAIYDSSIFIESDKSFLSYGVYVKEDFIVYASNSKHLRFLLSKNLFFNLSRLTIKKSIILPYLEHLRKIEGHTDDFFIYLLADSSSKLYFTSKVLTYYRFKNVQKNLTKDELIHLIIKDSNQKLTSSKIIEDMVKTNNLKKLAQGDIYSAMYFCELFKPFDLKSRLLGIINILKHLFLRVKLKGRFFLLIGLIISLFLRTALIEIFINYWVNRGKPGIL